MGSSENFPKEHHPYCFICKSQSFPKSGATHTQPNSLYVKKGFTRLDRQINKPLRKNTQTDRLITLENQISNKRMSSIRSVFCLWCPKRKSFSVTEKAMLLLWNWSVFIKGNYKVESRTYILFCFSFYETQEQNLWSNTCQALHCPLPSDSSFYTAYIFVSCHHGILREAYTNKHQFKINIFRQRWSLLFYQSGSIQE